MHLMKVDSRDVHNCMKWTAIGLYRENDIAIESEARDPFGGNVYYVANYVPHSGICA